MDIQRIAALSNLVIEKGFEEALTDASIESEMKEVYEYLQDVSKEAKASLEDRIGAETFIKMVSILQSMILAVMMAKGVGTGLFIEAATGSDLKGYSQTLALACIGLAMKEEIV